MPRYKIVVQTPVVLNRNMLSLMAKTVNTFITTWFGPNTKSDVTVEFD